MNLNHKNHTSLYPTWHNIARYIVFMGLIISLMVVPAAASWYNSSLPYKVNLTASPGTRPYDFNITISNATGTNVINASGTFIFCNGQCATNFSDIILVDQVNQTPYYHTILNNTSGEVHFNITQGNNFELYYGNVSDLTPNSKPYQTFIQYYPYTSGNVFNSSLNINIPFIFETNAAASAGASQIFYGWSFSNRLFWSFYWSEY